MLPLMQPSDLLPGWVHEGKEIMRTSFKTERQ